MVLSASSVATAAFYSFGASAGVAFYFNTHKVDAAVGAALGSLGWVLYSFVKESTGSEGQGYMAGAFAVAILAELLAFFIKHPATVFLVPGIIPLVPGGGIFTMMRAAVQGQLDESVKAGYSTLIAAGAIAFGVAAASSIARLFSAVVRNRQDKKLRKMTSSFSFPDSTE
ncbi:MAG: threonine/serine exporter family protein [Treponema sp.]|jgi:uncharacterized membrane protein YjjB (DUF3815 family)|nr:threonine/serine exporter family protein [Treponema sp.]